MRFFRLTVALCCWAPVCANGQVDMVAPSTGRPPLTALPSCIFQRVVGGCFDFENDGTSGWQPADWTRASDGYVDGTTALSTDRDPVTGRSLLVRGEFLPVGWSAIALELSTDLSLAPYAGIYADVLVPADSGLRFRVRFALVVGPSRHWVEMKETSSLEPGAWVRVGATFTADAWTSPLGAANRTWYDNLGSVHKIILRIEAESRIRSHEVTVAIDNIWLPEVGQD